MDYLTGGGGGGGALLCNVGYGRAAGTLKPLPFADINFGKIFNLLTDIWRKIFKKMYVFALLKILCHLK